MRKRYSEADKRACRLLLQALDRSYYLESLNFHPFPWQKAVANSRRKRKVINGARQSGKSTIVAGIPAHAARFYPGSLSIIGAPTEHQAKETMTKVINFCKADPDYPELRKCSTEEVELVNGSRIIVRAATSNAFRGYSCPRVIMLDEASRIEEEAYTSGARPMLTDNPDCELFLISTPFGREGFFYNAMTSTRNWERYEIRSPYMVVGAGSDKGLDPYMPEDEYIGLMSKQGIRAWYSPRHKDYSFQLEQLAEMGSMQYRQEYCCEFVEKNGQVFTYDEIAAMFDEGGDVSTLNDSYTSSDLETMDFLGRSIG